MANDNPAVMTLVTRLSKACEDAGITPPSVSVPTGRNRTNAITALMDAPNSDFAVSPMRKDDVNRIAAAAKLADVPIVVGYRRSNNGKDFFFLYGRDHFAAYQRADILDLVIPCRYEGSDDALKLAAASHSVANNPNSFYTLAALVSSFGEDWVGNFSQALNLNRADITRAAEIWADHSGLHTLVNDDPSILGVAHFLLSNNKAADVLTNLRAGSISPQQAILQTNAIMAKVSAERAAERAKTVGISVSEDHQAASYLADLVAQEHRSNQAAAKRLQMVQDSCSFIINNPPDNLDPDLVDSLKQALSA